MCLGPILKRLSSKKLAEYKACAEWMGYPDLYIEGAVYSTLQLVGKKEINKRLKHLNSQEAKDFNEVVEMFRGFKKK